MCNEPLLKSSRLSSLVMRLLAALSVACSRSSDGETMAAQTAAAPLPAMIVHKSESCGCCEAWVTHVRLAGFPVEVRNEDNLNPVKVRLGVPAGKGTSHPAVEAKG